MRLNRIDLADIHAPRAVARAVHEQTGTLSTSVPVTEIAKALDIMEVKLDHFDGFEGMLLTDKARSAGGILANIARGKRRARFTVAHELGHFLLERHQLSGDLGFRCQLADMQETRQGRLHQRQEAEANRFAIELLAPGYLVTPLLSDDPDLRDAQRMRDMLDISLEACIRKMIEHRQEPLAAVWSHKGRVRYSVRSNGFPFVTCKKGDRVPQTSLAFRAIQNGTQGFTTTCETQALAWTNYPELEIREQTRLTNSRHAVTLLWAEMPDDDDSDDGGLPELGTPGFR